MSILLLGMVVGVLAGVTFVVVVLALFYLKSRAPVAPVAPVRPRRGDLTEPTGWRLMPITPPYDMLLTAERKYLECRFSLAGGKVRERVYQALLEAAPVYRLSDGGTAANTPTREQRLKSTKR